MVYVKRLLAVFVLLALVVPIDLINAELDEEDLANPEKVYKNDPVGFWQDLNSNPSLLKDKEYVRVAFKENFSKTVNVLNKDPEIMSDEFVFREFDKRLRFNESNNTRSKKQALNQNERVKDKWLKSYNLLDKGSKIKRYDGYNITTSGSSSVSLGKDTFNKGEFPQAKIMKSGKVIIIDEGNEVLDIGNSDLSKRGENYFISSRNGSSVNVGEVFVSGSNVKVVPDNGDITFEGEDFSVSSLKRPRREFSGEVTLHDDFSERGHMTFGKDTSYSIVGNSDGRPEMEFEFSEQTEHYNKEKYCSLVSEKSCMAHNRGNSKLFLLPRQNNTIETEFSQDKQLNSLRVPLIEDRSVLDFERQGNSSQRRTISGEAGLEVSGGGPGSDPFGKDLLFYDRSDSGEICRHRVNNSGGTSSESIFCMSETSYSAGKSVDNLEERHKAMIDTVGIGKHYGSQRGISDEETWEVKNVHNDAPELTSCVGIYCDIEEAYPEDVRKTIKQALEDSDQTATIALEALQEEQGWEIVYTAPNSQNINQRYKGIYNRVVHSDKYSYPGTFDMRVDHKIIGYDSTNEYQRNVAREKMKVLKMLPLGLAEKSVGFHAFTIRNGETIEVHYRKGPKDPELYERRNLDAFFASAGMVAIAIPPGDWASSKSLYCSQNKESEICKGPCAKNPGSEECNEKS